MTSPSPALMDLLSKVVDGEVPFAELVQQIRLDGQIRVDDPHTDHPHEDQPSASAVGPKEIRRIAGATVDLGRAGRCGFGEVIYGEGKSAELIAQIIATQQNVGQSSLVTRIESGIAFQVRQSFPHAIHNPIAHTLRVGTERTAPTTLLDSNQLASTTHAAVISAGSTDQPVAEEAIETLAWMGIPITRYDDVGVAGPQRLLAIVEDLKLCSAAVVVAGMEGALPSVVGGHLNCPVFAVPTSVGYGAALGGLTPLMGMLTSCAANVAVVNIDAGFKGGYMAGLVVAQLMRARDQAFDPEAGANLDRHPMPS